MIRQVGLAPGKLVASADRVREILSSVGRGRIASETIEQLLQKAKESIGTRQAEDVAEAQLRSILDYLDTLRQQIAEIDKQLDERVEQLDSPLSSLGLTSRLTGVIHAESDPIGDFARPEQYVAYTGLDPSLHDSGDSIHGRGKISKRGSPLLRHALYMAAFVVCRRHDYFRRIYRKHRKQGKTHRTALVIVARRLARVIWRLLTDGRTFTARPPKTTPSPVKPRKSKLSTKNAACARV